MQKKLDFCYNSAIIIIEKRKTQTTKQAQRKEVFTMKRTSGWYYFADGYHAWFHGLSAQEKRVQIRKHGQIVRFIAD